MGHKTHTHTHTERERERERERVRNVPQACTVLCPGSSAGQYCSHIPEQRSSIRWIAVIALTVL